MSKKRSVVSANCIECEAALRRKHRSHSVESSGFNT